MFTVTPLAPQNDVMLTDDGAAADGGNVYLIAFPRRTVSLIAIMNA